MSTGARPLTFAEVDALAFAASRGMLEAHCGFAPFYAASLGPVLELIHLISSGGLPSRCDEIWIMPDGMGRLKESLRNGGSSWLNPGDERIGLIRTRHDSPHHREALVGYLMEAKRAARLVAGLPDATAGQLVAAMDELEGNIQEHSESVGSGLLACRAAANVFEFVVLDQGVGMLSSLRRYEAFAGLASHGKALQMALTDGISRFGPDCKRGHGFRPIFVGLANLRGSLRFRSGDYALTMDGTSPNLTIAQLAQKVPLTGFFASVSCFVP